MFNLPVMKEYAVISVEDPAVDKEKSNIEEYRKTYDRNLLVFNGEPTIFWLKPLTNKQWAKLMTVSSNVSDENKKVDLEKVLDASTLAIKMSLVRTENFIVGDAELVIERDADGIIKDECLKNIPFSLIQEIAAASGEVSALPSRNGVLKDASV